MEDLLKSLNQVPSPRDLSKDKRMSNKSQSTRDAMYLSWGEMFRFFLLIGDYQSALLLDDERCPMNPLPFKPLSYCMYLDYKCMIPGSVVLDGKGEPLLDINGNTVKAVGSFNSLSGLQKCQAAVKMIHQNIYPDTCSGPYKVACDECRRLNAFSLERATDAVQQNLADPAAPTVGDDSDNEAPVLIPHVDEQADAPSPILWSSCNRHANNPALQCSGSVLQYPPVELHFSEWLNTKRNTHVIKGCGQLLPHEVRKLKAALLLKQKPSDCMMWVIILVGITYFLRSDEVLSLQVEDFIDSYYPKGKAAGLPEEGKDALTNCQVFRYNSLRSFAFEVQGKTDKCPQRFAVFPNDVYPEFCVKRTLLWYIKTFNIQSGYLFPSFAQLDDCYRNGIPVQCHTQPLSYDSFNSTLKKLIVGVLGKDKKLFTVGSHTLRKTGYLFAVWGYYEGQSNPQVDMPPLALAEISVNARHQSVKHAATYQRDAATLFRLSKEERNHRQNQVGPYQSTVLFPGSHGTGVTPSTPYQKPLPLLAQWYYEVELGMGTRPLDRAHPCRLLTISFLRKPEDSSPPALLTDLAHQFVRDQEQAALLVKKVEELFQLRLANDIELILGGFQPASAAARSFALAQPAVPSPAAGRLGIQQPSEVSSPGTPVTPGTPGTTPRSTTERRPLPTQDPKTLSGKPEQLLQLFLDCHQVTTQDYGGNLNLLPHKKDKTWFNRHCRKALRCLFSCCGNDTDTFLEMYGSDLNGAKFTCKMGGHCHNHNIFQHSTTTRESCPTPTHHGPAHHV